MLSIVYGVFKENELYEDTRVLLQIIFRAFDRRIRLKERGILQFLQCSGILNPSSIISV